MKTFITTKNTFTFLSMFKPCLPRWPTTARHAKLVETDPKRTAAVCSQCRLYCAHFLFLFFFFCKTFFKACIIFLPFYNYLYFVLIVLKNFSLKHILFFWLTYNKMEKSSRGCVSHSVMVKHHVQRPQSLKQFSQD